MIRRNRIAIKAARSLSLMAILLGLAASSAAAAPEYAVEIEHDKAIVNHSDERVDYTVKVKNIGSPDAAPDIGAKLFCDGASPPLGSKEWNNESIGNVYAFSFQWVRNGIKLQSGEDVAHGSHSPTYTVQAGDAGKALQCIVKGTNQTGSGSYVSASQPVTVVNPQPVVEPPRPNSSALLGFARRPLITTVPLKTGLETPGEWKAGEELQCTAPTAGWSEATIAEWKFEWLRDGEPAPGSVTSPTATTSRYALTVEDVSSPSAPSVFQCMATAINVGGASVVESNAAATRAPAPEFQFPGQPGFEPILRPERVPVVGPGGRSLTVEIELPGGDETFAYKVVNPGNESQGPSGWSCDTVPASSGQNAKAICSRTDALAPGASYPSLKVITAVGADAPDLAVARATVFGGGAALPATAKDEFIFAPAGSPGLERFESGVFDCEGHEYTQAGGHPCSGVGTFEVARKRVLVPENDTDESAEYAPIAHAKQVIVDLPRGLVGNALAVPELCSGVDAVLARTCPPDSAIGANHLVVSGATATVPFYAIEPEFGTPVQLAFSDTQGGVITLSSRLRANDGYGITLEVAAAPKINFQKATATVCGFGAKITGGVFAGCREEGELGSNPIPLFTNPTRCGAPPVTRTRVNTWEHPDVFSEYSFPNAAVTNCEGVHFEPEMRLQPTSHHADSPTGLDVNLTMPTDGLESQTGISQANLKRAKITFPEGMSVNPSAGQGLGACSAAQVKLHTNDPIECPDSSKVGTVEIDTPLIQDTLTGSVYVARQGDVGGALIGLYLVFDSKKNGVLIKMPVRVDPDPKTGQLVATVDESPEDPFSAVRMHFPGGARATLLAPPKCGTYRIKAELTPWTAKDPDNPTPAETVTQTSDYEVTAGPGGGPCPSGAFDPKLNAGTEDPVAGKASPFVFRLTRDDGTQRFSALNVTTPPGLSAYLKGIPYCPDSVLKGISADAGTAQAQIDSPSCPAASQIGTAIAGAGAGADLFFLNTGKAYLAGPYRGAPLSLALVAPAVAGPLDLGNVVVRTALNVNPETAEITAVSDPIPTMLHGLLLDIEDIRVALDRQGFTLNPTNCEPMSIRADVKGENGGSASLSNRFQVGGCDKLAFKPKLGIRLFGGTGRGGHPSLKGTLEAKPGEANIGRAAVTIPRSEFLDQAHIRTICTRVQFAADACPAGAIYGHATATTPLLDYPVEGPVYLRSSNNKLPDLVVDLHGPAYQPIEAIVVGRIDSIKGQIRTTFENAPDVPLAKFTLNMQGGKKGLLVNSRDICASTNRATVALEGHNGMSSDTRPAVTNGKCNQERKAKHHHRAKR